MSVQAESTGGLSPVKRALLALEEMRARLEAAEAGRAEPVAIIGIGCRFPGGANDPAAFWRLLREGVDAVREVPRERWDAEAIYSPDSSVPGKTSARWGGFLDEVDRFDPAFFGISPREAAHMDPQQRLVLEVAWEALEDAGLAAERTAGSQTGVFLGIYNNDYAWLQGRELEEVDTYSATGAGQGLAANRVSYLLDLRGPSLSVDTTCSSSLVAVHLACQSLRSGECRTALAGGVNLILSPLVALSVSKVVPMAADGRCKTFDAGADGIVRGEGCGIVVLKRLADALADGDNVVAVIRGTAVNQDGHSNGFTAPSGAAQQAVIRQALQNAGLAAADISYIEAHGTGTPLGDPIELEALDAVFGGRPTAADAYAVGSVKTNVGHLEAAAGIAGLIKVALSLKHRAIPPHLHFTELNPHVSLANGSFVIPTELRPWGRDAEKIYAGVSSFSLGGTNAHVVLGEAPAPSSSATAETTRGQSYLMPMSARSEDALEALARVYRGLLLESEHAGEQPLYEVAYNASLRRSHFPHRLALVGRTAREMVTLLDNFLGKETHPGLFRGVARGERRGLVFAYSGQGTQWSGMGRGLWEREPVFGAALEECHELFRRFGGFSLLDELRSERDAAGLADARFAQPTIFAMQVALTALLREWGCVPDAVIGHSSGELAAAHAAGILSLEDAVRIVSARARLFATITGAGEMAAVELPVEESRRLLNGSGRVSIAASNSRSSTVLSGETNALREVVEALRLKQVRCRYLEVGCAYHSQQVEPLLPELEEAVRDIKPRRGSIPFVSTVTAGAIEGDRLDAAYWLRNARETVWFARAVERLKDDYDIFLEVGPHPALSGHLAQCLEGSARPASVIPTLRRDADERTMLLRSLGALYTLGHPVRWERLTPSPARHVKLPTYPWRRSRYWVEETARKRPPADTREPEAGEHRLLGRRLQTPLQVFETRLSVAGLPYLDQHRLGGEVVFPAAGYLEMALAAAAACLPTGPCAVEGMVFHERLSVPEDDARTVQTVITPETQDGSAIQVFGLAQDVEGAPRWTLHAASRIRKVGPVSDGPQASSLAHLRATFVDESSSEEFNRVLRERGFGGGGDGLPHVESLWRKSGEALGHIRLPQQPPAESAAFHFHPALLDSCFQTLFAALSEDEIEAGEDVAYISTGVGRFVRLRAHGSEVWSHVVVSTPDEAERDRLNADFRIYDADGAVVAEVEGLSLKRITSRALKAAGGHADEWLYEIQWEPKPLDGDGREQSSARLPVSARELADTLRAATPAAVEKFGLRQYLEVESEVDAWCAAYAAEALRDLGLDLRAGQFIAAPSMAERLGVLPRYERLLGRLFEMLCEDRVLAPRGDGWEVLKEPEAGAAARRGRELIDAHPAFRTELTLLARCGSELSKVLRGVSDPLELLFPGGAIAEAELLYQDTPFARTFNTLAEQAVRLALKSLPGDATIRVLEVGAGTGGTTASILPLLPAERTEYVFTDVSNLFLFRARRKFGDHPFINYKLLDIERDPEEQGFAPHGFDVIIAANVLHGTRDLRHTLTQVRRLLAADGLLLLLESTGPQRLVDLTFGLTEDWWNFADTELRPTHPLLSADKWLDLLGGVGFGAASAIPGPADAEHEDLQAALILAQAPSPADEPRAEVAHTRADDCRGSWLLLSDGDGVGDRLAEALRARGGTPVRVYVGATFEEKGDGRWSINPSAAEDFHRLVREATQSAPCRGVVYLWGLGAEPAPDSIPADALGDAALDACGSVLGLVQALARDASSTPPRLWIVTRGARSVTADDATVALDASPLWGLGPVVAAEHPEVWGGLIDLAADGAQDEHELLLMQILRGGGEDQTALRDGGRYAARLRRSERRDTAGLVRLRDDATYLISGGFGGMGLHVAEWMVGRGARNLVLVGRRGATGEEARACLRRLEDAGAKVTAVSADVGQEEEVLRLLGDIRDAMPPLRGVVHAAGVFDDRVLMRHDRERFARVLAPKVKGAWNLHRLTRETPLDFFVMFSSAAASLGLTGLGNYTAANAFLDALAHYRRGRGLPALSIDWGGWARVGMAEALGERREGQWMSKGLDSLTPPQGLRVLNDLMLRDATQVAVLNVDWPKFIEQLPGGQVPPLLSEIARASRRRAGAQTAGAKDGDFLRRFEEAAPAARGELLRDHIRRQVGKILELDEAHELDERRPLAEYGLDSLMAVELRNILAASLGQTLPATLLFDCPTIEAVHAYLAGTVFRLESVPTAAARRSTTEADGDAELQGILEEIEELPDDAVERMLQDYARDLLR